MKCKYTESHCNVMRYSQNKFNFKKIKNYYYINNGGGDNMSKILFFNGNDLVNRRRKKNIKFNLLFTLIYTRSVLM